jgi:hypothetical protein
VNFFKLLHHPATFAPASQPAQAEGENVMSLATIVVDAEKGIEIAAESALKFITNANQKVASASPQVLAALGTLLGGVDKALTDTSNAAQNPLAALINAPAEIADFKAIWPEVKTFVADLGIKI